MASGPHTFTTMSVFSPSRFEGTRIAVVSLRGPINAPPLGPSRKARIAADFGYDTCVFLYDAPTVNQPRRLEIYVRAGQDGAGKDGMEVGGWGRTRGWIEVGFDAGGVLAASHFIFSSLERRTSFTAPTERDNQKQTTIFLIPKSELLVPAFFNPYRQVAAVAVPSIESTVKVREKGVSWEKVLEGQMQLQLVPGVERLERKECPIVSVGGREWVLVDVSNTADVVKSVESRGVEIDGGKLGAVWYVRQKTGQSKDGEPDIEGVTCRVMGQGWEEEGNANGAAAVSVWLSLNGDKGLVERVGELKVDDDGNADKLERRVFGFQAGVEIGRPGMIAVEVEVKAGRDGKRRIQSIIVSGRANYATKGEFIGS